MLNASIGEEQNIFFESVFVLSEVGNVVVSRLRDGEQHSSFFLQYKDILTIGIGLCFFSAYCAETFRNNCNYEPIRPYR